MSINNLHGSYNRAVHAVFMCLLGFLSPIWITQGLEPNYERNLIFGAIASIFFCYYIIKSFVHRKSAKTSENIAFLWVPIFFVLVGLFFAFAIVVAS